ncbi:hypothetical protein ACHQM5_012205 [Ranunculus cassubicifolius]
MDSLENLVTQIQGLSNTYNDLLHLHTVLKKSQQSLSKISFSQLDSALKKLDPSVHSLGYLFILHALAVSASKDQAGELVSTVAEFIDSCVEGQIHLEPDKCNNFTLVRTCLQKIEGCSYVSASPIRGVGPMRTAIRKLQISPGKLTALHPDALQICLLAKSYKVGFSILEEGIFETDQPKDLFLYCYYGGMICIGQKCYRKAIELLYSVITLPKSASNAIAIEAYKKYIMVSLIHNGQFLNTLPKAASIVTSRRVKTLCQLYYDLGEIYSTGSLFELESFVEHNRKTFENENNLGLAKQVVSSLCRRNIQKLTKAYLTLSLEDIAKTAQLKSSKEAEMLVLQMTQDGDIFATINQKDGMVNFHEDPEQYRTCEMVDTIDSSIQRILNLSSKLREFDEIVSLDALKAAKNRQRFDHGMDDFEGFQGPHFNNHHRFYDMH